MMDPLGDGWKVGYRERKGNTSIIEFVRGKETVNRWTELLTLSVVDNVQDVDLDEYTENLKSSLAQQCKIGGRVRVISAEAASGLPSRLSVMECGEYADGSPESNLQLAIGGHEGLYIFQRARKIPELADPLIAQWTSFLKKLHICDTRDPARPCSGAEQVIDARSVGEQGGLESHPNEADYTEALMESLAAADNGDRKAQAALGDIYYKGLGVARNYGEALKWYLKAAEQGHVKAQSMLGTMYALGQGVSSNKSKAMEWFQKAADAGDAQSQHNLGALLEGTGTPAGLDLAIPWYKKAAEQGFPNSQFNLGNMYYNGKGLPQDYAKARIWLQKAAEQLHPRAIPQLAYMYATGKGGPKDLIEADTWFTIAAHRGDASVTRMMIDVERLMTDEQIKQARLRAINFIKTNGVPGATLLLQTDGK